MDDLITPYLGPLFDPQNFLSIEEQLISAIKESKINYDAIAFTGQSGSMIAPHVAARLNKKMLMVRIEGGRCHSSESVEGYLSSKKYVVIDDRIAYGNTIVNIQRSLLAFNESKMIGLFLYNQFNLQYIEDFKRTLIYINNPFPIICI